MKFTLWAATAALLLAAAACRSQATTPPPDYRLTASVKEIMDSMIDPSADVVWEAVATHIDATGVTEDQPRTDDEWKEVRRRAVTVLEATNLLLMPGRHVAAPGDKAQDSNVELQPQEIEARIAQDPAAWTRYAHGLHDSVIPALKAIDAKDATALQDAGEGIDEACETCHLAYWYPPKK